LTNINRAVRLISHTDFNYKYSGFELWKKYSCSGRLRWLLRAKAATAFSAS